VRRHRAGAQHPKTSALDDLATASIDAGRDPEALQTVQRITPADGRA
jgi:hypothetical protein